MACKIEWFLKVTGCMQQPSLFMSACWLDHMWFLLVTGCMQQPSLFMSACWLEDMRPPLCIDSLQGADLILTPGCKASKAVLVEMLPTFEAAGDVGALGRIAGRNTLRLDLKGKYRLAAPCAAKLTPQTTSHAQVGPEDCII